MPPEKTFLDPLAVTAFKRLFEREFGETVDAVRLGTEYGYARYFTRLALHDNRSSSELLAAAQRIRIALGRATVIDPERIETFPRQRSKRKRTP
jgi:hypothetical protein